MDNVVEMPGNPGEGAAIVEGLKAALLKEIRRRSWQTRFPLETATLIHWVKIVTESEGDAATRALKAFMADLKELRLLDNADDMGAKKPDAADGDHRPPTPQEDFLNVLAPFVHAVANSSA